MENTMAMTRISHKGRHVNIRMILITLLITMAKGPEVKASGKGSTARAQITTLQEVKLTDKEVHEKLSQLHSVIDALQQKVKSMNEGYNTHAQRNSEKMRVKFEKLSTVITKLSAQNTRLYTENKGLRQSNVVLIGKISALEERMKRKAELEANLGAEAWLRQTALELKTFLEQSGMEHFSSPRFSPFVAGVVSNGIILLPMTMTGLFLLHFVKQLSVLRLVMALNLFEVGIGIAAIASSALLLGDPLEGLRHISEMNFVFIQIVVAAVFWFTNLFLSIAIIQNRRNKAWKICCMELMIKVLVAVEYAQKVWVPVMDRDDVPIGLPGLHYALYITLAVSCVLLTAWANRCMVLERRRSCYRVDGEDDGCAADDVMVTLVAQPLDGHVD